MQFPTIHLNGTSAKALMDEIRTAHEALGKARDALANMTVHSRDYYVKTDKMSFQQAQSEHRARLTAIATIQTDLTNMYHGIVGQT